MAKQKIINPDLDSNLNDNSDFQNVTSQTIFSFGNFNVTGNFSNRTIINYENQLSSFVKPITLDDINISDTKSTAIYNSATNLTLNLDYSDLKSFIRYGSTSEYLRVAIQNIITNYPASLFVNNQTTVGGNITFYNYSYDVYTNISTFRIPSQYIDNKFGFIFNEGNVAKPNDNELKNLNLSFTNYIVWSTLFPDDFSHNIIGFTGDSISRNYITLIVNGDVFPNLSGLTSGNFNLHLRPLTSIYEDFILNLKPFEKYLVSNRNTTKGFILNLKDPLIQEDGEILYSDNNLTWSTTDGYNIDFDGYSYTSFLQSLLNIGKKYDVTKTDLIARFLTPASIKQYDLTDEGKMTKILRIYGCEFDEIRQFIDSLVNINKISYDKKNNIPDQLVKNLAQTFGWNTFSLVTEEQFVASVLDNNETNNVNNSLPSEIDIELWRRILINTNYFWKSKGTRNAIKSMFLLIGIPEPFINITEYVYTVNEKINPNTVTLSLADLPSASLPYNNEGYPVAPIETDSFYFQISGDTDNGQAYMNNFRNVGFVLNKVIDNKKSWVEENNIYRKDENTSQYYVKDERLILNTKEVDVGLDASRGIEFDFFTYIKDVDYPINSTGFTMPFAYVNLSMGYSNSATNFIINNDPIGDIQVSYNGIDLSSVNISNNGNPITTDIANADYYINPINNREIILLNGIAKDYGNNQRDVVEVSYIYRLFDTLVSNNVKYIVTRVTPNLAGTIIPLPESPNGDIQLTVNGIALSKNRDGFNDGDYQLNGNQIIIQNPSVISFLVDNPIVQVAYVISTNIDVKGKSEIHRIDSLNSSKFYFNNLINKYVYRLNYKISDVKSVRLLVNGICLEPGKDYILNTSNTYELYLPAALKLGDIIMVYYLIGGNPDNTLIINDSFGLGDITTLSFLEFTELIQRKLINAKTRKIISDFKGGFYPYLYYIFTQYLKRSLLDSNNPLLSNGYTFNNLYAFLNKYNGYFQKFVDELLPSTIIIGKNGQIIRNTIFTKQKYMYRRGVSFDSDLQWLGDNGTLYKRRLTEKQYLWENDFVCYNEQLPVPKGYLYNNSEIINPNDQIYIYNNSETGVTQIYIYNNSETITGGTDFDNFVTTVSLITNSIVNSGDTKILNYRLNLSNSSIPSGKILKLKLKYVSILENYNIEGSIINNQTAKFYINNVLQETYTNELNINGVQNEYNISSDINLIYGDALTGQLIIKQDTSAVTSESYNTINELQVIIYSATIAGSVVNIDNFNDKLSVSLNESV